MGNRASWHGEESPMPYAKKPQVGGRLSLSTHKGIEFPADFHEISFSISAIIVAALNTSPSLDFRNW
jgi:hypothetical protein